MPSDASSGQAGEKDGAWRTMVLAACLIATFMAAVESSIVATTIPTIVADLGGFDLYSWVFTIYLLTQAVSIPIYGRLADLYGRRPVIFAGTGLFLFGSTLCGLAWDMPSLILFRAIEGIGAGAIQPIAATILGDIYTPTERARVQGLVSTVFGVAAVIGPSMGAFLIQYITWRAVFWVNLPIGVASIVMLALYLKESVVPRRHRVDWLGSILLLTACASLMVALVQGGRLSWPALLGLFALGVAGLVTLVWYERVISEPMLPLELWRTNRLVVVGSLGNCFAGALMMGVSAFLPAYVQGAMGHSAIAGGLVLGAMSVSWAFASIVSGRFMLATSYRVVAVTGALALLSGCLMLVFLRPHHGPLWASVPSFVVGIGMGLCSSVFIVSIQASVPWRQRGAATSSSMFLRFVGQAVGVAGCGAVLNLTMHTLDPTAARAVDALMTEATRADLGGAEIARLTDIMAESLRNAYALTALFGLITVLVSFALPRRLNPRLQVKPD